ncbi:hypothetical protein PROFUN_07704 [Planoprotostelium fungivorum]|uniref:RBR-type E3 ubiquitin transferase n=1 Tax=Planoprotostelium fungivorum TaxID=1890364 RepID=A0A2P6MM79_9EUKA|nr:hypothetical protein PROFUN_07704 [Planoprotostelium fungivorum]
MSDDEGNSQIERQDDEEGLYDHKQAFEDIYHAQKQKETVEHVSGVTSLPPGYARILLAGYRWDDQKLLVDFTDNPEKVCKEKDVPTPSEFSRVKATLPKEIDCFICFDTIPVAESSALLCGHALCQDCWKDFLAVEVKEMKTLIHCPGMNGKKKCTMVIDESMVFKLLQDKEAEERFYQSMVKSYVEENTRYKWCTAPGCDHAICLNEANAQHNEAVECVCGNKFCFRCLNVDHRPATCEMISLWKKKCGSEDEDMAETYIAAISRPCPHCKSPIQKNDGCNHMTCAKCHYHFCWLCMGKFGNGDMGGTDGYGSHKCNQFSEEDSTVLEKRDEYKRFKFYSDRALQHVRSSKIEKKLLDTADSVVEVIFTFMEEYRVKPDFYINAVNQLLANRRVLEFSYAFGYFRPTMTPYVNKNIFEALQFKLEENTEELSKLIQVEETEDSIKSVCDRHSQITNHSAVSKRLHDALISAAEDWTNPLIHNKKISTKQKKIKPNAQDVSQDLDISKEDLDDLESKISLEAAAKQREKALKEAKEREKLRPAPEKEETQKTKKVKVAIEPEDVEPSDDDDDDMQKAIKASLRTLETDSHISSSHADMDEDEQLQMAIAASLYG